MKRAPVYFLMFLLLTATEARAKSAGETGAEFLNLGVGARPAALAGAVTAAADDANAVFWNPAGLSALDRRELSLTYNDLGFGIHHKSLAYAQPVAKINGTLALSFSSLDIEDIEGYSPGGIRSGEVKAGDMSAGLAYSRRIVAGLFGGAHVKWVKETLDDRTATTVATDLGLVYQFRRGLNFGASALNIGKGLNPGDPLPTTLAAGASYKFDVLGCGIGFSADQVFPSAESGYTRLGTEWLLQKTIYLRAGYRTNDDLDSGMRYGMGIKTKYILFDYAFAPRGDFEEGHYLTLTARY